MKIGLSKYVTEFLSPKIIFVLDLFFSVLASGIALFPGLFLFESGKITLPEVITWMCGSVVFSIVSMLRNESYNKKTSLTGEVFCLEHVLFGEW